MLNPPKFEVEISAMSNKELIDIISNGDALKSKKEKVSKELDKRKINLYNVKSYV